MKKLILAVLIMAFMSYACTPEEEDLALQALRPGRGPHQAAAQATQTEVVQAIQTKR